MTEKMGGVIHELEIAHIYIEQLHERARLQEVRLAEQNAERAAMTAQLELQEQRLQSLEAALATLTTPE
jgi:hypothetical protein